MKKNILIALLCALISLGSFSQTEEKRYYYAFDEKIFLNEVENKMVVAFRTNSAAAVKTLIGSTETEWQNDSIFIINVENTQKETLKRDLLQLTGIKSVQPLYVTAADGMKVGITDEIVMRFNKDASQQKIDKLHKKYRVNVKKTTDLYQLITVPNNVDALEIANQYQLSGLVKYSHPNFLAEVEKHQIIPNDPYFVNQFNLHNTGQVMANGHSGTPGADIRAPQAWVITKGSSDIIIAVLDDGVTANHPDLPNSRQVRLNGSNFTGTNENDPSPFSNDSHGNACAGLIAASHNNEGVAGIAPNCKIMPVRIPFGFVSPSVYADAFIFAKKNGAHILSNSWGYSGTNPNTYPIIKEAIENVTSTGRNNKGCIVVFSAGNSANHVRGNNGSITFPSNVIVAGVLTVGASDRYDQQANYSPTSNLNSTENQIIDILAPSHRAYSCEISTETFEVWSIDIPGSPGYNPNRYQDCGPLPSTGSNMPSSGTNYLAYTGYFGGTSAACPQVAGVAALILSLNPDLTQLEVSNIIKSTARKAGDYTYQITQKIADDVTWNSQMGHGVLNAYTALQATQESLPYNVLGTVFPFVYHGESAIDKLFNITAELHDVPETGTKDPLEVILRSTPRYKITVTRYDGTIHVPGTPKNPGFSGNTDNPGYPIDWWNTIGLEQGLPDSATVRPDEIPDRYVGVYCFSNVVSGDYILVLSRPGYFPRCAKITVPPEGKLFLDHREIIGGDINDDRKIDDTDINEIYQRIGYTFGKSGYNAKYDINGNGEIEIGDVSLIKFLKGFYIEGYTDTKEWLEGYK